MSSYFFICRFFLLYTTGFVLLAHGVASQAEGGIAISSSSGGIASLIRSEVNNMLSSVRDTVTNVVLDLLNPVFDNARSIVLNILNTIFMSDDTRVRATRQRRSVDTSSEENWSDGSSIMSMLSGAFIAPFKMTFGAVRNVSFVSVYERVKIAAAPVSSFLSTPAVQTFSNTTKSVLDSAVDNLWNFTKIAVLPQLNEAVTTLRNSNTLPTKVNVYLGDLQSLYTICHSLGIM